MSAARRALALGAAAFVAYGAWAAFANRAHGADAAVRAGLVQGCSSAFVTSTVAGVIEWAHARLPRTAASAALAVLAGVAFAAAFHVGLHVVSGTPEVARTVAVPIAAAVVYAVGYAATLRALARPREAARDART
ncbi:MAG: hypothetical protein U0325_10320 [Polyangiales bacterium]